VAKVYADIPLGKKTYYLPSHPYKPIRRHLTGTVIAFLRSASIFSMPNIYNYSIKKPRYNDIKTKKASIYRGLKFLSILLVKISVQEDNIAIMKLSLYRVSL
jgi:hypothetical protein